MIIVGFDPGLEKSGYGVIDASSQNPRYIASGLVVNLPAVSYKMHKRLAYLHQQVKEIIKKYNPAICATEYVYSGNFTQSSLHLAMARGVILSAIGIQQLDVISYSPSSIKKIIAGNGRASKETVSLMMQRHLKLQGNFSEDAADALAVALCLFYEKISHNLV